MNLSYLEKNHFLNRRPPETQSILPESCPETAAAIRTRMAGSRQDPFEVGSDMDEDEALRYAIALSLQEQELQGEESSQIPCASTSTSRRNGDGSGGAGLSLLSLDRKKMEEERLQRLAKRRRSPTDEDVTEVPPPKRVTPCVEPPRTVAGSLPTTLLPYPKGAIKRTWAYGYPRTPEDIKIEEVFQKDKLELALLSSYQWDDEWLVSKFDLRKTKLLLLAFADSEAQVCINHRTRLVRDIPC